MAQHYFQIFPQPHKISSNSLWPTIFLLPTSRVDHDSPFALHGPAYRIFLISLGSERSCPFVESLCCRSVKIRDGVWTEIFPPFTQSVKHMFLFDVFHDP